MKSYNTLTILLLVSTLLALYCPVDSQTVNPVIPSSFPDIQTATVPFKTDPGTKSDINTTKSVSFATAFTQAPRVALSIKTYRSNY